MTLDEAYSYGVDTCRGLALAGSRKLKPDS